MSNIEEIEDAMGVISELLELCKQQHDAAGDCLKEFKLDLRIFDKQTGELVKAADDLQDNIKQAVTLGVMASLQPVIRESLADTPKFVESALNPIFQRLDIAAQTAKQTTETAEKANARLNRAVLALGWKMAAIACGVAGVLVLSVYLAVWWNRAELESLTAQKAEMEKNIAVLDKVKGQIKLETCKGRPCVGTDESEDFSRGKQIFRWMKGVY